MTSNLIPTPNTQLSSEVFTKKASLIARGLNEISLLKPSPESLYQTGMDYYEGSNGKPWDILKAYAYLVKSAEQGFALAQWRLACIFIGDEAVEKSEEKEKYWRKKAALNGHLMAIYELLSVSSETYIQELTNLAESGCINALDAFVNHYLTGDHKYIKKDMKQAWYWVKRSVEQKGFLSYSLCLLVSDNATAEFWREVDKDNGYWLPESRLPSERYSAAEREQYYENQMIWLIEKAQQGEAFAQCTLADELKWLNAFRELSIENWRVVAWENALYQQAIVATGEPIDGDKLAIFWLTKAIEQGLVTAQDSLGFLYYCMDEHEKAVYWLRKYMEGKNNIEYFKAISGFNETDSADAPKFTLEELEHYRLTNHDSI
jgi:uncharacterized protein